MLPREITGHVLSFVDPTTFIRCLFVCRAFHGFDEMERENKMRLVRLRFDALRISAHVPVMNWSDCRVVGLAGRIDRGIVSLYDLAFTKEMLNRTHAYMVDMEECDNPFYRKDVSIVRSMLQGIRISLHLRGLTDFGPGPGWLECPDEIRDAYFKPIWHRLCKEERRERYFACQKIAARRRHLHAKYLLTERYPALDLAKLFRAEPFRFVTFDPPSATE